MTAQAVTLSSNDQVTKGKRYLKATPITFVQKNVRYFVYTDGSLDFKSLHNRSGHGSPYTNIPVKYDNLGRVIKVGYTPIYYNSYGKVDRIGKIGATYHNKRLKTLGGIYVKYDYYGGIAALNGYLTPYSDVCGTCNAFGCSIGYYNFKNHGLAGNAGNTPDYGYTIRNRSRRSRY